MFSYKDKIVKFKAPYSLECYVEVKEWNNGYLVIMAKYKHNKELEEDCVDLIPILDNLFIDSEKFLKTINKVVVQNN